MDKDERLTVRFTAPEFDVLAARAHDEGLTTAQLVRVIVLKTLRQRPNMTDTFRLYVKNRSISGPHYVDFQFEEVEVKGDKLLHPHISWSGKQGGAEPYAVYGSREAAINGATKTAAERWQEQYNFVPHFVSAEEYLKP